MHIAVIKDAGPSEHRVAATPETVKTYVSAGHTVSITKGAGKDANFSDEAYKDVGAKIATSNTSCVKSADIVFSVNGADAKLVAGLKKGAGITGLMNPTDNPKYAQACAKAGVTAFALEYIPRISRAQSMDVLSSQSNLAGYRSVVEGAGIYGRAMPMMMTAAGTVAPAKVFIMGVGVAGLQAIAKTKSLKPPKRLGATPSRCRRSIKNFKPTSQRAMLQNRISSSRRRLSPVVLRRS